MDSSIDNINTLGEKNLFSSLSLIVNDLIFNTTHLHFIGWFFQQKLYPPSPVDAGKLLNSCQNTDQTPPVSVSSGRFLLWSANHWPGGGCPRCVLIDFEDPWTLSPDLHTLDRTVLPSVFVTWSDSLDQSAPPRNGPRSREEAPRCCRKPSHNTHKNNLPGSWWHLLRYDLAGPFHKSTFMNLFNCLINTIIRKSVEPKRKFWIIWRKTIIRLQDIFKIISRRI